MPHQAARPVMILGPLLTDAAVRQAERRGLQLIPSKPYPSAAELTQAANAAGAQAFIVRMGRVPRDVLIGVPTLAVVAKHGVGVDGIDLAAARDRDVPVLVAGGANAQSVAEQALALLLSVARSTALLDRRMREGHWDKPTYAGTEISGKAIGLVGLGAIGRAFLALLAPFRPTVRVYDPFLPATELPDGADPCDSLDELLEASDVVSLHCPLTEASRGMIDAAALRRMGSGAILINTARGELVDEAALVEALRGGIIAGAGLDTFAQEPPPADSPMWSLDRLVASPHVGANTREARDRVGVAVVDQIADYLDSGALDSRNHVNGPTSKAA